MIYRRTSWSLYRHCIFMAASAMLRAFNPSVRKPFELHRLFDGNRTDPGFLQMHAGEIDEEELALFSERGDVEPCRYADS